jgi:pilus assembly protein CpaB
MQRHRVLIAFVVAWFSALGLSWWLYRASTAPEAPDVVRIVAAAKDLPVGKRIEAADLKWISIVRQDAPVAAFFKREGVVDRAVSVAMSAGEPVLPAKLAGKGSGEGLTALIEPGMRAVSVQVNEISGVSGFVQPGTRVDVLFTRVFTNGDAATTTILQNVKVIAYGRQLDPAAKAETRDGRPTVATLLVTQSEAERLVLAEQRGRIQLALRNTLDSNIVEAAVPVQAADLGIEDPRKPQPAAPVRPIQPPPAPPVKPAEPVESDVVRVRVYRGDKVTEEAFK